MANFADCPLTLFVRALKATKALRGIEILPGAPALARQTAPQRIVIWPADGEFDQPGDVSVSIFDDKQQVIVECWGKGSSSGGQDETALQDWNAAWNLVVRFMQGLVEQGENPQQPTAPGSYWEVVGGPSWEQAEDATKQGTAIRLLCMIRCPIPAAPDDEGHVGDNWTQGGPVAGVDIEGAP
jgi:hypothetical protein